MLRPSFQLATRQVSRRIARLNSLLWYRLALMAMLTCLLLPKPTAQAITITFSYDERERPAFDPDGTELKRIAHAAADIWESYILDDRNYHFDLSWENLGGQTFGLHEDYLGWATNNILIDTKAPDGSLRNWFFDPTPFQNEEFSAMRQTLVRDKSAAEIDAGFSGNPQDVLEIGYNGFARSGSGASGRLDLLSVVLHEIGHDLGLSYNGPFEDYYDFNSATVGGRNVGVLQTGDYEINLDSVLMTDWPSASGGERRLPSATDILATYDESVALVPNGLGGWKVISFQNYNLPRVDFIGEQSNSWHNTLNWIGGKIPDTDNEVFIRHGGLVFQTTGNSSARAVHISDGSKLFVQGAKLNVLGDTELGLSGNQRSELQVGNINGQFSNFQTQNLNLIYGLVNLITSQSSIDVNNVLNIQGVSTLMGAGTVRVAGKLVNDGQINGGTFLLFGFGGKLTLGTSGVGATLDLDGASEQGVITANLGDLAIFGPLADDFNGTAAVAETRTMSFSKPWKMMGNMYLRGGADESHLATLTGNDVTVGGNLEATGKSIISAPMILNSPSVVNIPNINDTLILSGPTTLRGGSFTGNGTLAISGATNVAMPNPNVPDKFPPIFNAGLSASLVSDDAKTSSQFDILDATFDTQTTNFTFPNFTTFALNVPLQVRTGGVVTASVSALYLPKLATMSGGQITGTNTVNLVGDLMVDQNSTINPSTFLWGVDSPNHRTTVRASKRLDLTPNSIVRGGNPQEYRGHIVLETGATLHVDLGNSDSWTMAGDLDMGLGSSITGDSIVNTGEVSGNGFVNVNRFENSGHVNPGRVFGGLRMNSTQYVQTPSGVLDIALGSSFIGNGSGLLQAGTAQLAGTLELSLISGFNPTLGTEIDILTANSISGQFGNVLFNAPFGSSFSGDLLYRTNRVSFRLTQFGMNPDSNSDFNGDGKVDGADLVAWQKAYGSVPSKGSTVTGDADGDGDTDGRDFLAWQRQVSRTSKGSSSDRFFFTAVPEPSTLFLGLLALPVFPRRRPLAV